MIQGRMLHLDMATIDSIKLANYNTLVVLVNNAIISIPISDLINSTNKLSNNSNRLNNIKIIRTSNNGLWDIHPRKINNIYYR